MRLHEFIASLWQPRSLHFRLWQLIILALRGITLLAYLWLGRVVARGQPAGVLAAAATGWSAVEACFFIYYKRIRSRLQALNTTPHRCRSPAERRRLVERCIAAMVDEPAEIALRPRSRPPGVGAPDNLRSILEGWFLGTPLESISRADFASWCAWAFFSASLEGLDIVERDELDELITVGCPCARFSDYGG